MKLWAKPCTATQEGWVMVESSDNTCSTGEGNVKPLQYSCLENPINSMKRKEGRTLKDELPRSVVPSMLLEISGEITPERMKRQSEVAQSCLILCNPMDYSLPCSSIHGIFQARVMEWVAISFFRGYSQPGDRTQVSCITGRHFTIWATREAQRQSENNAQLWMWLVMEVKSDAVQNNIA